MVQWSDANTSVASQVAVLRSDVCQMARSQGAIMKALQERSQQLQQVMSAAQKLLARAPETPPLPEARAQADSLSPQQQQQRNPSLNAIEMQQQQQQQRRPSLNAIEMLPLLEARTLVADMSSVHKAVQRENMRLHEGNGDVQSGGRWDVPGCHTARHSAHTHSYTRTHTRNRGDGESARWTPRGVASPKVSDLQVHAQLEEGEIESESEREAPPSPPPPFWARNTRKNMTRWRRQ
jgi:hypothetical protein